MESNINHLISAFSLIGIAVLFFILYRDYRKDLFREKLFSIRDQLFLMGAEGKIDFESPAYGALRSIINSSIRSGHRCGLMEILTFRIAFRKDKLFKSGAEIFDEFWKSELEKLAPEARRELKKLRGEMHYAVAEQVFFTSSLLMAMVIPAIAWVSMKALNGAIYKTARKFMKDATINNWGNAYDSVSMASDRTVTSPNISGLRSA